MPLKPEDRAEYMRGYRARKTGEMVPVAAADIDAALGIETPDEPFGPAEAVIALTAERDALLVKNAALIENIQTLGALNLRNDTIWEGIVAERDALREEVKHLQDVLTERDSLLEQREAQIARQAQSPELAEAFRAVRPDIPTTEDLAQRYAETFGTGGGTDATRVAGSHASGPWTPEFRPAPKSVAEPKPKRRR